MKGSENISEEGYLEDLLIELHVLMKVRSRVQSPMMIHVVSCGLENEFKNTIDHVI